MNPYRLADLRSKKRGGHTQSGPARYPRVPGITPGPDLCWAFRARVLTDAAKIGCAERQQLERRREWALECGKELEP